ncbi:MAG: acetylglutamate kinase [Anaerolineales bacterium]|nr:acetylglutamate kinase [Anaerolineales bacterium]
MQVIKIGGNELDELAFRQGLATAVATFSEPVIIVHGGGKAIADMQQRLGLQPVKVDGVRVTDAASLDVAQMVLSGHANKLIVSALLAANVQALGISGVDGGLLRCQKKHHPTVDLGYVGEIVQVNTHILHHLLAAGVTPVVSPISLGLADGQIYNVNADDAAAAIARAASANLLTFVSNVPGVLDQQGQLIPALTAQQTEDLILQGVIHGGMIPKVRAALQVISQDVPQARIVNLAGLGVNSGTLFTA